jgi:hypothetical protein
MMGFRFSACFDGEECPAVVAGREGVGAHRLVWKVYFDCRSRYTIDQAGLDSCTRSPVHATMQLHSFLSSVQITISCVSRPIIQKGDCGQYCKCGSSSHGSDNTTRRRKLKVKSDMNFYCHSIDQETMLHRAYRESSRKQKKPHATPSLQ